MPSRLDEGIQSEENIMFGRTISTIGAAALVLGLGAALPVQAQDTAPVRIAFVSGPLYDSFFPPLYQGANDAAKDLGVDLNYIPIDEHDIEASSARTMQAAIASAPDAIVVGSFISTVVDPLIKQAVAAGIPVYVNQSGRDTWKETGAFGFVGQDPRDVGFIAADRLKDGGSKNILCVINVPGNPYLQSICRALNERAAELGIASENLELPTADSTDLNKVQRKIGAYLTSHPDIDGIFTPNALVGAASTAAVDTVQKSGKVLVGTMQVSQVALDQIENGKMLFLINEQPYLDGYYGVLFAYHYVKYGLAPVGEVSTGPHVVDASNIEKIKNVFNTYANVIGSK